MEREMEIRSGVRVRMDMEIRSGFRVRMEMEMAIEGINSDEGESERSLAMEEEEKMQRKKEGRERQRHD